MVILLIGGFIMLLMVIAYITGIRATYDTREVFQITKNIFDYGDALTICQKIGVQMATKEQVKKAAAAGARWKNLGWVSCGEAYYPNGSFGMVGGKIPPQVKLGVNCYGIKPTQTAAKKLSIAHWNGPLKWSLWSRS